MTDARPSPVSFPVWDAVTSLAPPPGAITTMYGDGEFEMVGFRRGADDLTGPGMAVFSFAPSVLPNNPVRHAQTALLELVTPFMDRSGEDAGTLMAELMSLAEPASDHRTISVRIDGTAVEFVHCDLRFDTWAAWSTDTAFPVAITATQVPVPALSVVTDWTDWLANGWPEP